MHYTLDGEGTPVYEPDLLTWARWYEENPEALRVRKDTLTVGGEEVLVSTVFLASDHDFRALPSGRGPDAPVLWELMVFGGADDGYQERFRSKESALERHRAVVELLKAGGTLE